VGTKPGPGNGAAGKPGGHALCSVLVVACAASGLLQSNDFCDAFERGVYAPDTGSREIEIATTRRMASVRTRRALFM
jgi:hypothetical protein